MMVRALWGAKHYFQDSLFFLMLKIILNGILCMFGVVVLVQNKFEANHTHPWWYGITDNYLPVFLERHIMLTSFQHLYCIQLLLLPLLLTVLYIFISLFKEQKLEAASKNSPTCIFALLILNLIGHFGCCNLHLVLLFCTFAREVGNNQKYICAAWSPVPLQVMCQQVFV